MDSTVKIKVLLNCNGKEDENGNTMSICYFIARLSKVFEVSELVDISDNNKTYLIVGCKKTEENKNGQK